MGMGGEAGHDRRGIVMSGEMGAKLSRRLFTLMCRNDNNVKLAF